MIIDIIKGFYPYFAIIALIGIVLRIHSKKWKKEETILFLIWLGHALLTIGQICIGAEWVVSRRYILPVAPLAFGWAGYAIYKLRVYRYLYYLLPFIILFLMFDALRPSLEHHWKKKKIYNYQLLSTIAPVITNDWQGKKFYRPQLWWDEYRSPALPIVQCEDVSALGYFAGGRSWTKNSTERLSPNYCIFINEISSSEYFEIYRIKINKKTHIVGKRKND